MFTDSRLRQVGVTLVEVLVVISLISIFAGFGISTVRDYLQEQSFLQVAERARLIADDVQRKRKIQDLDYDDYAGEMTLRAFVNSIGASKIEQYMPELLESDPQFNGSAADFFTISFNPFSVQVSWAVLEPENFTFSVPFAANVFTIVPPATPDDQEQRFVKVTVTASGHDALAATYARTHLINTF